jgi:hypothetical protein
VIAKRAGASCAGRKLCLKATNAVTSRAAIAGSGLITASALLVHLSGGHIERHFHLFVVVIIIAPYQEWLPFLLPIGYIVSPMRTRVFWTG